MVVKLYCAEDRIAPFLEIYKRTANVHGYSIVFPVIDLTQQTSYKKFTSVYKHMSANSANFELACFRRYFLILTLVKPGERFIISDSDLYFNANIDKIPKVFQDFTHGLVGSVGIANGVLEADISPHFSLWSTELLRQFVEYIIYAYEERVDDLESIYSQRRKQKGKRVAISDMTILYDWVTGQNIPFLNSNQVVDEFYFDHNISMLECLNGKFKSRFGTKKIYYSGNEMSFKDIHNINVRPLFIHLPGRHKLKSVFIHDGKRLYADLTSIYICLGRSVRSFLNI